MDGDTDEIEKLIALGIDREWLLWAQEWKVFPIGEAARLIPLLDLEKIGQESRERHRSEGQSEERADEHAKEEVRDTVYYFLWFLPNERKSAPDITGAEVIARFKDQLGKAVGGTVYGMPGAKFLLD